MVPDGRLLAFYNGPSIATNQIEIWSSAQDTIEQITTWPDASRRIGTMTRRQR